MIKVGIPGAGSPALADFQTFNTTVAPRAIDQMLFFQSWDTEPLWYAAYEGWANTLNATIMTTISSSVNTLNFYAGGANDTAGLNSGGIAGLAATAKAWGKPVIVRPFHEFNGNWNTYGFGKETAAQFVAGWKHIVDVFRAHGATNIQWCWCPNVWGNIQEVDPTVPDGSGVNWYPGDNYVDIVALDGYMNTLGPVISPQQVFLDNYQSLRQAFPSKPFGIAEVGCAADSRLSVLGGKAGWYALLVDMIRNYMMTNFAFINTWQRITAGQDYTLSSSGSDLAAQKVMVDAFNGVPFIKSNAWGSAWSQMEVEPRTSIKKGRR